jgi:hypothetical protein
MDPEHPPVTARQPFKLVPVKAHHSLGAHALITWGYSGLEGVKKSTTASQKMGYGGGAGTDRLQT